MELAERANLAVMPVLVGRDAGGRGAGKVAKHSD